MARDARRKDIPRAPRVPVLNIATRDTIRVSLESYASSGGSSARFERNCCVQMRQE
jgi:hypothetical protein